jgi:hypothetical protein
VRGTVILVEVGKLPRQSRKPKKLWLWWSGEGDADFDLLWRHSAAGSTSKTPYGCSSKPSSGALPGSGTPSRPTVGVGW